jgi:hypothetical protein
MIIDGHSHACGEYLTSDSLIATIDKWGVDKVILVPGELLKLLNAKSNDI